MIIQVLDEKTEMLENLENTEQVHINNTGNFIIYKNDYIANEIKQTGDWEPEFNNFFKNILTKDSNVIDIGAFVGTNTIKMARHAKHVYSFEPFHKTLELLNKNLILNDISNVTTYNLAVGNEHKTINKLWFPIKDINWGCMRINKDNRLFNDSIDINVDMIKLDDITINERVDLIKIDVEGCEEEVLKGGINFIKKCKPVILIENWSQKPYEILLDLNYECTQLTNCNQVYTSKINYCDLYNWTNDYPTNSRDDFYYALDLIKHEKELEILEIGTFAGVSIIEMISYLNKITNYSTIKGTVIDTWRDYPGKHRGMDNIIENAFHQNIKTMNMQNQITVLKGTSRNHLINLIKQNKTFNLIYVDGSHLALDCFLDLELSWELLKQNGILIVDDYLWKVDTTSADKLFDIPFKGANKFFENHNSEFRILVKNYRVFLQKL